MSSTNIFSFKLQLSSAVNDSEDQDDDNQLGGHLVNFPSSLCVVTLEQGLSAVTLLWPGVVWRRSIGKLVR